LIPKKQANASIAIKKGSFWFILGRLIRIYTSLDLQHIILLFLIMQPMTLKETFIKNTHFPIVT